MKIDLSRFRAVFFQEAAEHVDSMETGLLSLSPDSPDPEVLNAIFRAAHSIKGGSATFAFEDITRFTHALEELLDRMRKGDAEPTTSRIDVLLRACDVIRLLLTAAETNGVAPVELEPLLASIREAHGSESTAPSQPREIRKDTGPAGTPRKYEVYFRPSAAIFREGMDPLLLLRELRELGTVNTVVAHLEAIPGLDVLRPDLCYLAWTINLITERPEQEIRDVFAFAEDGAEIAIKSQDSSADSSKAVASNEPTGAGITQRKHVRDSGVIRVATEKVDQLIDVVGELLIAQSMAVEISTHFKLEKLGQLQAALAEVDRNTRELQERVMAIRMLPIGTAFARLPRVVHDIATAHGKDIRVETAGEESEIDKTILEGIVDPLTHIVRNSADHGIETIEERRAVGKAPQGTILLRARHEGGNFLIEVSDDGRGLNAERIRQKAMERGLLTGSEDMSEEQIQALIFQPGFSTADTVSEVSGRGVGMDVVRRNVEALGGSVSLKSRPGKGTTLLIKLPLTLAIMEGQLVRVGTENYVLPLVSIVESIRPSSEQVHQVAGRGEVVVVRREPVPLLRLHCLFGIATDVVDPSRGLVAIVEHEQRRLALLVDELLGQQQVVIKSLQTNFRKVPGAMGATILGDGKVSLILDVPGLVDLSTKMCMAPPSYA